MPVIPTDSEVLHLTLVCERGRGWFAEVWRIAEGRILMLHTTAHHASELGARRAGRAWAEARR